MQAPLHIRCDGRSWPRELSEIEAAPDELWVRGRLELLVPGRRVAIVGTRSPTPYGEAQARRFASELATAGCVVVSGLARGIDACAHEAALEATAPAAGLEPTFEAAPRPPPRPRGKTIAVLGSGVDRPWPAGALAERMVHEGLLLSEYPPGTAPRRHHFPLRNRLIAGLASAVLVVEAAHASGSLITARWANDQGREVFALPGRVDQPMARGCHRLLRAGARLVESPGELLQELGWLPASRTSEQDEDRARDPLVAALTGDTARAEELARRLGRPLSEVLAALVELELRGLLARSPGGLWRRLERRRSGHAHEQVRDG